MNERTDEGLTGQQLAQMTKQATAALQTTVDKMNLRERCLELAVRASTPHSTPEQVMALARSMYEFLALPAQSVHVRIDPP